MERQVIPELLDSDSGTPQEVATALLDLRFINRAFGGVATSASLVERAARGLEKHSLSMLEVAAGSGFLPREVQQRVEKRGIHLQISLLDRAYSHLRNGKGAPGNGTPAVTGDALHLPFRDDSFDLVSCNLFVHHLSPQETVEFVNEGLRVCRGAVLINDLMRSALHLGLVYAGLPLFRSRITRHDAVASVRRAYTNEEMRQLLAKTRASRITLDRHYLFRLGILAWKN
jgi:ubiquinone/menaquinone biosynthesis C-methylase UbiE